MLNELHTNPTQLTGLLAFGIAALACARAAMLQHGRSASVWHALAVVQTAFFLEILLSLRHRVHDLVDVLLESHGWYAERSALQVPLIVVAVLLALGAIAWLLRWRGIDVKARAAVASSVVALGTFVVEAISLHGVDALMYGLVGPVKRIACLWAASAAVVALMAMRSAAARPGSVPASRR